MPGWKAVWKDAISAATARLRPRRPDVERGMKLAVDAHRTSLESIVDAYVDGRIDKETFEGELAEEKRVFTDALTALRAVGPKRARDAANAFFRVIETAA